MATMLNKLAIAFSVFLCFTCSFSNAQTTCSSYTFTTANKAFLSCSDLPHLNSFLHWNYDQATGKFEMAYRQTSASTSNWVAWAINRDLTASKPMLGSQALVAIPQATGNPTVRKSPVTSYTTNLAEGNLSYNVTDLTAEYTNGEIIIYGTWELPAGTTSILQVWQEGPMDSGTPSAHSTGSAANVKAFGALDLVSGQTTSTGGGGSTLKKKRNIHAVLNVVSWGILIPLGAMVARYLKTFKGADPTWFYLHAGCQTSAYIVGVAGWATGIKLGSESSGIEYDKHRTIGIILFALGTLQVFALLLRPNKDHKFRIYWNMYHHATGYAVIILSIVNIFLGFDILKPNKNWKNSYMGLIIALGVQAILLEAYTGFVAYKTKQAIKAHMAANAANGNGHNGYGA